MKVKLIAVTLALSALAFSAAARADAGADVLKSKGCVNCHDAEKKKMGPSYKDIAAKNAGKADAVVPKVMGGKHPKVNASEAEVKSAVETILKTK